MLHLTRTTAEDPHFAALVTLLDADLAERDGADHFIYAPHNSSLTIKHAIVAYYNEAPAGCGAIRELDKETMEVKRMYTLPASRGKGVASKVLQALEQWAAELGYKKCRLETGKNQPEALALYHKSGYQVIPNYGPYAALYNSVCFEKHLAIVK